MDGVGGQVGFVAKLDQLSQAGDPRQPSHAAPAAKALLCLQPACSPRGRPSAANAGATRPAGAAPQVIGIELLAQSLLPAIEELAEV